MRILLFFLSRLTFKGVDDTSVFTGLPVINRWATKKFAREITANVSNVPWVTNDSGSSSSPRSISRFCKERNIDVTTLRWISDEYLEEMVMSNIMQVKLNFVIIEAKLETKGPTVHYIHVSQCQMSHSYCMQRFLAGNLMTTRAFYGGKSHAQWYIYIVALFKFEAVKPTLFPSKSSSIKSAISVSWMKLPVAARMFPAF